MSTQGRGETVLSFGKQSWQLQGGGARAATFFHRLRRERPAGRAGEGTRPGVRGRGIGGHSLRYPERVSAPQVKRRNAVKSGLLRHKGHWSGSCQLRQQLLLLASGRPPRQRPGASARPAEPPNRPRSPGRDAQPRAATPTTRAGAAGGMRDPGDARSTLTCFLSTSALVSWWQSPATGNNNNHTVRTAMRAGPSRPGRKGGGAYKCPWRSGCARRCRR